MSALNFVFALEQGTGGTKEGGGVPVHLVSFLPPVFDSESADQAALALEKKKGCGPGGCPWQMPEAKNNANNGRLGTTLPCGPGHLAHRRAFGAAHVARAEHEASTRPTAGACFDFLML